jgi:acyl-CoA synthetase
MVMLVHQPWRQAAEFHRRGDWESETFPGLLCAAAERLGGRTAYVEEESRTTWSALLGAASGLGRYLQDRGVRVSEVVVLVFEDGPEIVAATAAVQGVGAVSAPLSHSAGPEEIATVVSRTGARVVLTDRPLNGSVPADVVLLGPVSSWEPGAAEFPPAGVEVSADDVSDIMFTSGTTGRPKGVMNTANTKLAGVRGFLAEHPLTDADIVGVLPPMSHNAGWLYTAVPAVAAGATLVTVGRGDPVRMLDRMERHRVTVAFMVPTHMHDLVTTYRQHPGRWDLSLRLIITGAAPSQDEIVRAAVSDWGVTVVSMYGMIECQGITFTRADDSVDIMAGTVGRACPGVTLQLVDPDTGRVVSEDGVVGEVVAAGPLNFVGYFEDEAATGSTLSRDGWLSTGDLGQWHDGSLKVVGRRKEVILRGGMTLSPDDIEQVFADLPEVGEVVVVGLPDPRLGERVCLAVTGQVPSREELQAHLGARGWGKHLLPDDVRPLTELPRTELGKPKRTAVRAILLDASAPEAG